MVYIRIVYHSNPPINYLNLFSGSFAIFPGISASSNPDKWYHTLYVKSSVKARLLGSDRRVRPHRSVYRKWGRHVGLPLHVCPHRSAYTCPPISDGKLLSGQTHRSAPTYCENAEISVDHFRDFGGEVVLPLFDPFAFFETGERLYRDLPTEGLRDLLHVLFDGELVLLHIRLVQ